ncbi:hypothetical protein, partial [Stenotrophomonas sp.]|uniref:hypothetical protein n=1 Tax=Stenotrophomonas sp. TaxID=69392 RepID=UPI0028A014CE
MAAVYVYMHVIASGGEWWQADFVAVAVAVAVAAFAVALAAAVVLSLLLLLALALALALASAMALASALALALALALAFPSPACGGRCPEGGWGALLIRLCCVFKWASQQVGQRKKPPCGGFHLCSDCRGGAEDEEQKL